MIRSMLSHWEVWFAVIIMCVIVWLEFRVKDWDDYNDDH